MKITLISEAGVTTLIMVPDSPIEDAARVLAAAQDTKASVKVANWTPIGATKAVDAIFLTLQPAANGHT